MGNKVLRVCGLLFFLGVMCFFHHSASAITVDGNLSDWGVTPFTNWVPTLAGTSYTVEDNTNRQWSDKFYEAYDIEAMYIQDCQKYLNFAIVSSWPYVYGGYQESIFLDFTGRTSDQLLIKGDYKYAADLANLPLDTLSTKGVYKVNQDWVYTLPHENGAPYIFPVSIKIAFHPDNPNGQKLQADGLQYHDLLGTYQVYNKYIGDVEPGVLPSYTYVLEGRIDKSLFGDENLTCGSTVETYFSNVSCLKDWITVRDALEGSCVVPEPATLMLLGFSGIGMALLRRKMSA